MATSGSETTSNLDSALGQDETVDMWAPLGGSSGGGGSGAGGGGGSSGGGGGGGVVRGWEDLPAEVHAETVRAENSTRRIISLTIVGIFAAWALVGGYYLMFHSGDLQVLIDGSAFIAGPLGVVIGYYFGVGDDPKRK